MTWRGRTAFVLVYGVILVLPMTWLLVTAADSGAWQVFQRATERADLAGELANSIFLALLTTGFGVLLGLPLALLLNLRSFPGRRFLGAIFFLPLLVPPHIHTIAWTRVIGDKGWLTGWLAAEHDYVLNVRAPLGDPGADALCVGRPARAGAHEFFRYLPLDATGAWGALRPP